MTITVDVIAEYKKLLTNPIANGLPFRPIAEIFEKSDTPTPKHILYEQYKQIINRELPKMVFYVIMDELYKQGTAPDGNFGYYVKTKLSYILNT